MRRAIIFAAALSLAACGSVDLGDLGGILGSPSADQPSDVRGTVTAVDTTNRRIDLNVAYVNQLRQDNTTGSIYYDSNTRVEYQGKTYNVTDLERGDEISVTGANTGGRYVASVITVTRDATGG